VARGDFSSEIRLRRPEIAILTRELAWHSRLTRTCDRPAAEIEVSLARRGALHEHLLTKIGVGDLPSLCEAPPLDQRPQATQHISTHRDRSRHRDRHRHGRGGGREPPSTLRLRARWGARHLELAAAGAPAIAVVVVVIALMLWFR
jgi:hypothetical protein